MIKYEILPTQERHSDMVDAMAYMIAGQELKIRNEYVLVYIKKKTWWLPEFAYRWLLKKLFVLTNFI